MNNEYKVSLNKTIVNTIVFTFVITIILISIITIHSYNIISKELDEYIIQNEDRVKELETNIDDLSKGIDELSTELELLCKSIDNPDYYEYSDEQDGIIKYTPIRQLDDDEDPCEVYISDCNSSKYTQEELDEEITKLKDMIQNMNGEYNIIFPINAYQHHIISEVYGLSIDKVDYHRFNSENYCIDCGMKKNNYHGNYQEGTTLIDKYNDIYDLTEDNYNE